MASEQFAATCISWWEQITLWWNDVYFIL